LKTETSALLHYNVSPLKIIEKDGKDKAWLLVLNGEEALSNQRFSLIKNASINESANWDASWFSNYE
jgi:hypothetical protein